MNLNEIKVIKGSEILGEKTIVLSSDLFDLLQDKVSSEKQSKEVAACWEYAKRAFERVGGSE